MSLFPVDFSNKTFVCFTSDFSLSVILSGGEMSEWCAVSKIDFSTLPKAFELKTYFSCFPIFQTQFSVISSQNTPDTFRCQTQKTFGKGGKPLITCEILTKGRKEKLSSCPMSCLDFLPTFSAFSSHWFSKLWFLLSRAANQFTWRCCSRHVTIIKLILQTQIFLKWNSANFSTQRCVSSWLYNHVIIHRHNMA